MKNLDLPPLQLFNLKTDPSETNNVYQSNPDKTRELYALLENYVENGRSTPGPNQQNEGETNIDPSGFEKIKSKLKL
jgi:hypothetical protein